LIDGEALEINQDDGTAKILRDLFESILDVRAQFSREQWITDRVHTVGQSVRLPALGPAQMVVTRIHGDPIQPGAEGGFLPVTISLAKNCEECFLSDIEGGFTIAQHPQANAEDPVLMSAHQLVEGSEVSSQIPPDEVDIFSRTVCHLSLILARRSPTVTNGRRLR
jgi:hypothetical protein